ncbi:hypothetical protein [Microbacterium amylolyticum]|uniref:Integral membrane protein n=1 Tax=Microbacterium amylolyticum TaxID=936337 RepID=A0ABS4ZKS8_9MICO|nr:hypothetical protein [Microbacterium amylolyticum]MBP2437902.1 hypothetical protein [Microbacterium amylolyticum]
MIAHLGTILPSIVKTQLDSPIVNWDFIGISAATEIYGGIFTLVLILCGIALLTGAVLLAFGKIGQHQGAFTGGLWTVGLSIFVAALASSVAALINFGAGINLG